MVLRLPATTDRLFVLQFFDFDTNVIGSSSTRTRPDQGQTGFDISASTHPIKNPPLVWMIGRIIVKGESDLEAAVRLQDGFELVTYSEYMTGVQTPLPAREPISPPTFD
jgi:Protein of unknown function (DUF1254)